MSQGAAFTAAYLQARRSADDAQVTCTVDSDPAGRYLCRFATEADVRASET